MSPSRGAKFLVCSIHSLLVMWLAIAPISIAAADDGKWSFLSQLPQPSNAALTMMYDEARGRMLMFGGDENNRPRAEIWARPTDGSSRWAALPSDNPPNSVGLFPNAIFDSARDRIVIWDGWNWTLWTVSLGPILHWNGRVIPNGPNLDGSAVAFDAIHRRMLLWSGGGNGQPMTSDVWALSLDDDGGGWSSLPAIGPAPTPRSGAAATIDVARNRLIVHGGTDFSYTTSHMVRGDIWALPLSGVMQWTPLFTADDDVDLCYTGQSDVVDTLRNRLLIFGGATGDYFNSTHAEIRAFSLDGTNSWSVAVPPDGERKGVGGGVAAAYDGASDAVIEYEPLWDTSVPNTRRLTLSGAPAWTVIETGQTRPPIRFGQATAFDPVRRRWLSFGGRLTYYVYYEFPTTTFNDLWSLSIADRPEWAELAPGGDLPPERQDSHMVYDPVGDAMILFGGNLTTGVGAPFPGRPNAGTPHFLGDTWRLALAGSLAWSPLEIAGPTPDPRDGHVMVLDSRRHRILVFGGRDDHGGKNDLWSLALDGAPQWTRLEPLGVAPSPRWQSAGCYDVVNDRLVIASGRDSNGTLGDSFQLAFNTPTLVWSPLPTAGAAPPIGAATRATEFDFARRRLLVFGNADLDYYGSDYEAMPEWQLSVDSVATWAPLTPASNPPSPRYGMSASLDPIGNRLVLFGGTNELRGSACKSDGWLLELGSTVSAVGMAVVGVNSTPRAVSLEWWTPGPASARVERCDESGQWRDRGPAEFAAGDRLNFTDGYVTPGGRYGYRLRVSSGTSQVTSPEYWVDVPAAPSLSLGIPEPNPSSRGAHLDFNLPVAERAEIAVFDIEGRRRETHSLNLPPGTHSLTLAERLEPGLYIVRLTQGSASSTRRICVVH